MGEKNARARVQEKHDIARCARQRSVTCSQMLFVADQRFEAGAGNPQTVQFLVN